MPQIGEDMYQVIQVTADSRKVASERFMCYLIWLLPIKLSGSTGRYGLEGNSGNNLVQIACSGQGLLQS